MSKKYRVGISVTIQGGVSIQADSMDEALDQVECLLNNDIDVVRDGFSKGAMNVQAGEVKIDHVKEIK